MNLSDADLAAILRKQGKPVTFPVTTKKRRPMRNDESRSQQALIQWWAAAHKGFGVPECLLFAIPNGGRRSVVTASIMKREGVRAGTPDLFLAVGCRGMNGMFIEMKTEKGVVSSEQEDFIMCALAARYYAKVCRSTQQAIDAITAYLT